MTALASATETARNWASMVKLSHTIFALPFALASAAMAAAAAGGITVGQIVWILVAMFAARNAAMSFNRLADVDIDRENPRTRERELPSGRLSRAAVIAVTLVLVALFVFAAFQLNRLCGLLSPVALAIVFGYSFTKRFTWACHLVLGLALAIAPVGAWVAVTGSFSSTAWLLGLAVGLWVAGFDVVYACQDFDHDREVGLFSIPSKFGLAGALWIARALHVAALATLAAVGVVAELHPIYAFGWLAIAGLLVWEHRLVRVGDLSRVSMAFFNANGMISVAYFLTVLAALLLPRLVG